MSKQKEPRGHLFHANDFLAESEKCTYSHTGELAELAAQATAHAAIATADAAREMCDLLREVLTELQAQRRPETHVEHGNTVMPESKMVDLLTGKVSEAVEGK